MVYPNLNFCDDPSSAQANANAGNVYGGNNLDGALMKANKWTAIFNNKDYLNCKGKNERRSFRMFMLSGTGMNNALENPNINDEIMYTDIPKIIEDVLSVSDIKSHGNIESILDNDNEIRDVTRSIIKKRYGIN